MLHENPAEFRRKVDATLKRHFLAIKELVGRGTYFFDYGNSFMKAVYDAGVPEIARNGATRTVSSSQLRGRHYGAGTLRLRLRAFPLGMS